MFRDIKCHKCEHEFVIDKRVTHVLCPNCLVTILVDDPQVNFIEFAVVRGLIAITPYLGLLNGIYYLWLMLYQYLTESHGNSLISSDPYYAIISLIAFCISICLISVNFLKRYKKHKSDVIHEFKELNDYDILIRNAGSSLVNSEYEEALRSINIAKQHQLLCAKGRKIEKLARRQRQREKSNA